MAKIKAMVTRTYYTWHPNFIDHGDGTYETVPGGNWVVEWDVKIRSAHWCTYHHRAVCDSEVFAKRLLNVLNRKRNFPKLYGEIDLDDICFKSGRFCLINRRYTIVQNDEQTPVKQAQS